MEEVPLCLSKYIWVKSEPHAIAVWSFGHATFLFYILNIWLSIQDFFFGDAHSYLILLSKTILVIIKVDRNDKW